MPEVCPHVTISYFQDPSSNPNPASKAAAFFQQRSLQVGCRDSTNVSQSRDVLILIPDPKTCSLFAIPSSHFCLSLCVHIDCKSQHLDLYPLPDHNFETLNHYSFLVVVLIHTTGTGCQAWGLKRTILIISFVSTILSLLITSTINIKCCILQVYSRQV
jgi:hypothetical protein